MAHYSAFADLDVKNSDQEHDEADDQPDRHARNVLAD